MTTNVQAEGPDPWAEIAAELRRIADDAVKLVGQPAPSCFQINIQPKPHNEPAAIAAVDTIALALLGKLGKTKRMHDGAYHRDASGRRGLIDLSTYRRVPGPTETELEILRARVAELEARDATGYSSEADDPTPVSGARIEPHVGGMTEGGLVDETPAPSFTVHFSFGHGQTDPDTGEHLLDKYVTVIAPTYDACREAMFASRYGNRYSSEYEPSGAVWLKWKPQWTEHEVINAMPKPVDETGDVSYLVDHGPVKPPYGTPERADWDSDHEFDHLDHTHES